MGNLPKPKPPETVHLHYYIAQGDGIVWDFCKPDNQRSVEYVRKDPDTIVLSRDDAELIQTALNAADAVIPYTGTINVMACHSVEKAKGILDEILSRVKK